MHSAHPEIDDAYRVVPGKGEQIIRKLAEGRTMVNSRAALGHDKRGKWTSRLVRALVATSVLAATALFGIASPAAAGGAIQISGTADFDDGSCDPTQPDGFGDFTLVLSGDLNGCWYTSVDSAKDNGAPSGVYRERGREVFIGTITINGEDVVGTFTTEYHFTSKWDPDVATGTEVHGRCQHPIVEGLGNFTGLSGRLDFKDDVDFMSPDEPPYHYRGHVKGL